MKNRFYLLGFILLPLYIFFLPLYIQGGDTAELVMASYHRLVAHPPGYPLYMWMQYIWTHFFTISTVFWRASFLNSLMAVTVIGIMGKTLKKNIWIAFIPIIFVGIKFEFIEASILPDVFSLHALVISLLAYFFLFSSHKRKDSFVVFFLALGFSNHLTIIFLLPCVFYILGQKRDEKNELIEIFKAAVFGIILSTFLYSTLLISNPEHPLSWGSITNLTNLIKHFLRYDYGTFKLSASTNKSDYGPFLFLVKSLGPCLIFSITVFGCAFFDNRKLVKDKRFITWTICLISVFLFSLAMNIVPVDIGREVLSRFHLMPLIVLFFWMAYAFKYVNLNSRQNIVIIALAILPLFTINIYQLLSFSGLRSDSTIEDYARTMYDNSKKFSPSVVVANTDASYFAIRYIQSFDKDPAQVAIISIPLLFNSWYYGKIKLLVPQFQLQNHNEIVVTKNLHLENDIIYPNLSKTNFLVTDHFKVAEKFKIIFLGLGRVVQAGSGISFLEPKYISSYTPDILNQGPQHFTKAFLFYQYSHYYLAHAHEYSEKKDKDKAKKELILGLKKVPYSFPIMTNLCSGNFGNFEFCSTENLDRFKQLNLGFY